MRQEEAASAEAAASSSPQNTSVYHRGGNPVSWQRTDAPRHGGSHAEPSQLGAEAPRDADLPALFLVGLNTCVPTFTAEADSYRI